MVVRRFGTLRVGSSSCRSIIERDLSCAQHSIPTMDDWSPAVMIVSSGSGTLRRCLRQQEDRETREKTGRSPTNRGHRHLVAHRRNGSGSTADQAAESTSLIVPL